tara:strand:- start:2612 stop:3610 length:999 start_codon:yes stop_codon:yes gene_type:complete
MKKINIFLIFYFFISSTISFSDDSGFDKWKNSFKKYALTKNISEDTFNVVMKNVKFLPKVIEYDRYQPEFYEDTFTYISKRTSNTKLNKGIKLYNKNSIFIDSIDKKYFIEKELLLALMGIETNFGKYLGKMDIISSLATLSYDERRSEFFTSELITLLQLIEKKVVNYKLMYGSWAGAFGNFQFMPSTIKNYAIDANKDNKINLKSIDDSFASAANYLNKLGWKKNAPCYLEIELFDNVPNNLLNTSAQKIKNKKKLIKFKKYIKNYENINLDENINAAIITPDKDIVENANPIKPAFLVFDNYELILKWNRSLRFALAVCHLKDKFTNAL